MIRLVLGFYAAYLGLAVGVRMLVQRVRTGSTGYVGMRAIEWRRKWLVFATFGGSYALGIAAPILSWVGADPRLPSVDRGAVHGAGIALFVAGLVLTLWAQLSMGASWRIGVAADERTDLVQRGPFSLVRNPIYSAMLLAQVGLVLCLPNASAIAAFLGLLVGVELQVRRVEEPYLLQAHGAAYDAYRRRVGRFFPRLHLADG